MTDDRRLIEDFLPIQAISAEASREKSVRKGHISTLHLWWARRPLVACRAAVYGALVPASKFIPKNGPDNKKQSLGRANAAKFIERLCQYPGNPAVIKDAQRHILEAHAERLTEETGRRVAVEDIEEGRAPRPKVLDMFAGGGSIPLEALRLGCEAYALDLNPVAHIIELCTLVYPQKYGKPDPNARGMTGPRNAKGETTWGGLAKEVRYWGEWVLKKVKAEIGDLYPLIPDPDYNKEAPGGTGFQPVQQELFKTRRNLPHWQSGGSTYFVTFRTNNLELKPEARTIVLDACRHFDGDRYRLRCAVVMPDHVHLLLQPEEAGAGRWHSLSSILHSIKSFTGNRINTLLGRKGTVWQDESYDRIVRNESELLEKWNYIRNNPVKKGLVCSPDEWVGFFQSTGKMPVPPDCSQGDVPPGYLMPVAYLWTRTVRCKNPTCGATVPLVKQTWLCKKKGRYVALKVIVPKGKKEVEFGVVEATTEEGIGFDPAAGSKRGNATCPFCGSVNDVDYVKFEGRAGNMGDQLVAVIAAQHGSRGWVYLGLDSIREAVQPNDARINQLIQQYEKNPDLCPPTESIAGLNSYDNSLGITVRPYGMTHFANLFTRRQLLFHLSIVACIRSAYNEMADHAISEGHRLAVRTLLSAVVDRATDFGCKLCVWNPYKDSGTTHAFGRQTITMVWDYSEANPFNSGNASWILGLDRIILSLDDAYFDNSGKVFRGSAIRMPFRDGEMDAVITDPPYYDNVPYSDISDFFYVWLRRAVGELYPEHFAGELTPKKSEAIADANRHNGDRVAAKLAYEQMMANSFSEASRALKPNGQLTVVYAHKTTLGWATLVAALRSAGFTITEAWPLDTEKPGRLRAQDSAALASSILLVARKRDGFTTGSYEEKVRPELDVIVRERVDSLWKMGITGADLVIAAVGAGLRAYTRFSNVEYANGEEVPAEKFLAEVEGVVLETLLEKIFMGQTGGTGILPVPGNTGQRPVQSNTGRMPVPLGSVDGPSRFYVLWRYTYKSAEMDAGEAIVFTYGQNVELDGPNGLSSGNRALAEKRKGTYRLRDFTERGNDEKLGMPKDDGKPAALIDALHRILWLLENEPRNLNAFLDEARLDRERLRLVAQTLAGTALEGGQASSLSQQHTVATTPAEGAALKKLVANWRALIEARLSDVDLKTKQVRMRSPEAKE